VRKLTVQCVIQEQLNRLSEGQGAGAPGAPPEQRRTLPAGAQVRTGPSAGPGSK